MLWKDTVSKKGRELVKILVVCQHYWPEPYPLQDLCEEMVKRGHEVHVVTGVPNYPMGVIYPEYRNGKGRRQEKDGVKITRTFTIGRRHNILFRFLNYYSYAISSTRYVRGLKDEYDVVFTNQTSPIMMTSAAMAYAKKWNKKVVLYCMDLWPASLAAGGISEDSPIYRYFHHVSKKLYRKADEILITSQMFRDYLRKHFDIPDEKIIYHPQYADDRFGVDAGAIVEPKETVDLVFAGNVGAAQSLTTVIKAAKIFQNESRLRWHIVGDGSELNNLKAMVREFELENIIFHGRKPLEDMPKYYAMADAMMVTLTADPFISLTLPGKVQTYMASGKPIIAAANGEIPNVINSSQCGFWANAEDEQGLAEVVRKFIDSAYKSSLGKNAREYYDKNFTRKKFMDKLEAELMKHAR